MQIYLIRHTTPDVEAGICYGQSDIGVDDDFQFTLEKIKNQLSLDNNHIIFSSPLKRCSLLAKELANHNGVNYDDRLMEMDFGKWELQRWSEIDEEPMTQWGSNFVENRVPGGESFEIMNQRVMEFWEELLKQENKDILIVTHSGVIRSILARLLEIPLKKAFVLKIDYGRIIRIRMLNKENSEVEFL